MSNRLRSLLSPTLALAGPGSPAHDQGADASHCDGTWSACVPCATDGADPAKSIRLVRR